MSQAKETLETPATPEKTTNRPRPKKRFHGFLLLFTLLIFAWSAINPADRFTWALEVAPVVIGLLLLVPTYSRFRLTNLLLLLLALHAAILMVGGKYTYAEVPFGHWIAQAVGATRNPYDRIGHFAQGFVPAILAREILLRKTLLQPGKWLFFLVTCVCLAFSAFYELIEWWTAAATGQAAEAFLGTQGDVWDTQWDMFLALTGSLVAQLTLSKAHDRQLSTVAEK